MRNVVSGVWVGWLRRERWEFEIIFFSTTKIRAFDDYCE